jgi:hypothetical protein
MPCRQIYARNQEILHGFVIKYPADCEKMSIITGDTGPTNGTLGAA